MRHRNHGARSWLAWTTCLVGLACCLLQACGGSDETTATRDDETMTAEPEPPIPAEIVQQQQAVQEAQTAWRAAEERWAVVRDSLRVRAAIDRDDERPGPRTFRFVEGAEESGAVRGAERLDAGRGQSQCRRGRAFLLEDDRTHLAVGVPDRRARTP